MFISEQRTSLKSREIAGIILAGGASKRMGKNKALLPWHGNNLLDYLINVMTPYCKPIVVSAAFQNEISSVHNDIVVVHDSSAFPGPLFGIQSALKEIPQDLPAFITGCDYPFIRGESIQFLHARLSEHDAVVFQAKNLPQPLPGLYHSRVRSTVDRIISSGKKSLNALLDDLSVHFVCDEERRLIDADDRLLINVNTQADYEQALQLFQNVTLQPEFSNSLVRQAH